MIKSPPADPSDHPAEARRERLRDAALRVIARDGIAAASTRAIAGEAGLTSAMIHYAFDSKEQLLGEVLTQILDTVQAQLRRPALQSAGLGAAVEALAEAYWAHVLATPELQRAQYELTLHALTAGQPELARAQYEGYVGLCRDAFLSAATTRVERRAAEDLAGACVALVDGAILQLLATGDRTRAARRLRLGIRALVAAAHDLEAGGEVIQ
jgi:AcrR family transcriptional regulator